MRKWLTILMVLCAVAAACFAEKGREGFTLDTSLQGSYNPIGVQLAAKLHYSIPLSDSEDILWKSTKIDVGISNELSPAYDIVGAYVTIEPIAFFSLSLSAKLAGYYDALGFGFYDLSGYGAEYDDAALKSLTAKNAAGYMLSAAPTLQLAIGPVAMLNTFTFTFMSADGGSGYFYDRYDDCTLAKSDIILRNETYLLYTIMPGIMAGVYNNLLTVPASGYLLDRLVGIGIYSTRITEKLSINAVLMAGTALVGKYYVFAPYVGGQVGISLDL